MEREGKIREKEWGKERERWKACRVNPTIRLMLSPNYGTRACKKGRGKRTVSSLKGKASGIMSGNYPWIISGNYHWELWERERDRETERERWKARRVNHGTRACKKGRDSLRGKSSGIIRGLSSENYNYQLVYHHAEKVEIYRDTGVSKNVFKSWEKSEGPFSSIVTKL